MRCWVCYLVLWVWSERSVAQFLPGESLPGAGALAGMGSQVAVPSYPVLVSKVHGGGMVSTGCKLYGTALGAYGIWGWRGTGSQGLGLGWRRLGTADLGTHMFRVAYGRQLMGNMELAATLGVNITRARGYGQVLQPLGGLGLGAQLTDRCRWMLQAESGPVVVHDTKDLHYSIRSGIGYRCSDVLGISVECHAAYGVYPVIGLGIHYMPLEKIMFRCGYMGGQFLASGGFFYSHWTLEAGISWHAVLGIQQTLVLGYQWSKPKP